MNSTVNAIIAPLRQHPGAALLAASIPLTMPWEALNALAILIGAICGGVLLWRQRGQWSDTSLRYLAAVSACLLLPCLLSAFDAYRTGTSWLWVTTSIRFPLFAAALILLAQRPGAGRAMQTAIAIPVLLWLVDALIQACFGFGLGGAADADRLSGIFGNDDLKLGPAMAVLAPVLLVPLLNRRAALIAALLAVLIVVLLAGARAGWIGMLVGIGALACYRWGQRPRRLVLILAASAALMLTLASIGYHVSSRFAERVDRTAQAFRGDRVGLDHALAGRLPIFATAWDMTVSHSINGVGVRGFRYAYPDHAGEDDPWINAQTNTGAAHPHYLWLEVSAEQGLLGVLGLLVAHWLLIARWRQCAPEQRRAAIAPAAALLVLMFPLNTHPALYSSFWGAVWWWLIGLFIAFSAPATGVRNRVTLPPELRSGGESDALRWNERALLTLLRLGCALPVRLLLVLARLASWPLARLARGRRRVVLANLHLCLPDWDAERRSRLADRNLRSTAVSLVENLIAWYAPKSHIDLRVEGAEHLQLALSEGRGAILLTPHFTMIEMVPRALSLAANGAWQLTTVVRRHNAPSAEAVIDAGRRRWSPTIDKKDVRGMLRALKNNRALISAADQNFSYGSVFAPFFGVPAATTTGNIRLAKSAGCPTLPCMVRRLPGGHSWQVRIDPPLENFPSADPLADATRSNAMVEAEIRQIPEQYLWAHRRFRSSPDGEQPLYNDDVLKPHHRQQELDDQTAPD